jgi:hypothetical protein
MLFRRRIAAAGYLGLAVVMACAPAKTAAPAPGVDPALRPFVPDPAVSCGPALSETAVAELRRIHRELLRSADAAAALAATTRWLTDEADALPGQTLRGEALLVAGQAREAVSFLAPYAARSAECPALGLVLARAQEAAGDLPEAYAGYVTAGGVPPAAGERARGISARALEMTRARFTEAVAAGRREAAGWHLGRLERLWPNSEATLRSSMEMSSLAGDARGELAAVKALQASRPADTVLSLRRGQLELEVGDARTGLALIEALAAASPADGALQVELGRAKFAWRLINAPEQVRGLRGKAALSRADLAVLLYWMVPQIRTARPGAAQIASDILDHPSRDEIARVANLGLMSIDETLHRFSPDAPLRRADAVSAFLRLLAGAEPDGACALPRGGGREALCRSGVACGLFEDVLLCQAGAGISGAETIEMLRRALDRMESV